MSKVKHDTNLFVTVSVLQCFAISPQQLGFHNHAWVHWLCDWTHAFLQI